MKTRVDADAECVRVNSATVTPANASDVTQADTFLRGEEHDVFPDAGFQGLKQRTARRVLSAKHSVVAKMLGGPSRSMIQVSKNTKGLVSARFEHVFHVVKNRLGLKKTRVSRLDKNARHVRASFALASKTLARKRLLDLHTQNGLAMAKI